MKRGGESDQRLQFDKPLFLGTISFSWGLQLHEFVCGMNTTWYSPCFIPFTANLSPANAAVIPLAQNEATWSVIIDINGEMTSTIDAFSTPFSISKTDGNRAEQRDLPYPVGKDTKTSFPLIKEVIANSYSAFKESYPSRRAAFCSSTRLPSDTRYANIFLSTRTMI